MKVMAETQSWHKYKVKKMGEEQAATGEEQAASFITAEVTGIIKSSVRTGPQRSLNNRELRKRDFIK